MPPRVLLLTTPLDERTHLDGARLAAIDLARGLLQTGGARPVMLRRPGASLPENIEGVTVEGGVASVVSGVVRARPDVVHAMFAPRRRTSLALGLSRKVLRAAVVQTLASRPRRLVSSMLVGDVVVATSDACASELRAMHRPPTAEIPMPFAPPVHVEPDPRIPRDAVLFVGDAEPGRGLEETIESLAQISRPHGAQPVLVVASRNKSREAERALASLDDRCLVLGEQPSLLPWIAGARCVLLPSRDSFAKLDHPRVLLEAIALGTRVVVGTAQSLAELVVDPSIGEIARDTIEVRDAIERSFDVHAPDAKAIAHVLLPRGPSVVAAQYAEIYASLRTSPSS